MEQALEKGHIVTAFARNPSKVGATHPNLRVVKGDILNPESVESALRGQEAVLSALGVQIKVLPLIAILIVCRLIAKFAGLIGPLGLLVRWGLPLLAYFILFKRTSTLSDGTKNILRAMEKLVVK